MLNIIILGAPGSGKGTQSELMIAAFGLDHISTGEIMRAEIKKDTELGRITAGYINNGGLLPDELTLNILAKALDERMHLSGIIFDGFPRTLNQAEALDRMLAGRGEAVSAVIELKADDEVLVERLLRRSKITGRPDDNDESTIRQRLAIYHQRTEPLVAFYKACGRHYAVDGIGTVEDVFNRIREICRTL
ncbi:MAG: adenylate kinase [Tannerellaceae bacterium]|jgi:adenylate kinase|nr:adenylate kinase [Tannerellaceae bacterium]